MTSGRAELLNEQIGLIAPMVDAFDFAALLDAPVAGDFAEVSERLHENADRALEKEDFLLALAATPDFNIDIPAVDCGDWRLADEDNRSAHTLLPLVKPSGSDPSLSIGGVNGLTLCRGRNFSAELTA